MMLNDCYDLILGLKFLNVERAFAEKHYADLSAKPFFGGLVEYIVSGPVVAMIWEGKNVVLTGRKIIGATNPAQSEPGTIRGDFAIDIGRYRHVSVPIFPFSYSEL
jgi:nucleoside-diphosphate kinase